MVRAANLPPRPQCSAARLRSTLRIKTRAQFRRHDWTQIVALPEHAITNPRDEVIHKIAQPPRYHAQHRPEHSPNAAQSPQNMQERLGTHEQRSVPCQYHHTVRQSRPSTRRHACQKCLALQRREPKRRAGCIFGQNKPHRVMAQPTMSIVKKIFRGRGLRLHRKSIARAPTGFASTPTRGTPRLRKFPRAASIAIAETRRPSRLPAFPKISKLV
jgi:hypothetical protein